MVLSGGSISSTISSAWMNHSNRKKVQSTGWISELNPGKTAIGSGAGKPQKITGTIMLSGAGKTVGGGNQLNHIQLNRIINIMDARLLMNHIANPGAYPVNPCTGNVDGINGIDMHDLVLLLKHIFDPAGNPLNCPGI